MFKKPFSFNGRIRRAEYFISYVMFFYFFGMSYLTMALFGLAGVILLCVGFIPACWFIIAQGAKRSHDLGNSGFFQYVPFYRLLLLFADGQKGENEYGLNPKGIQKDE